MTLFEGFDHYLIWFGVATLLLALEAMFGSFRYLAASIAAVAVGVLSYLYPYVAFPIQILFFSVIAAITVWMAHSYLAERQKKIDKLRKIVDDKAYVGRTIELRGGIRNGVGTIDIDGMVWRVKGRDCPTGTTARVIDMEENILIVETD